MVVSSWMPHMFFIVFFRDLLLSWWGSLSMNDKTCAAFLALKISWMEHRPRLSGVVFFFGFPRLRSGKAPFSGLGFRWFVFLGGWRKARKMGGMMRN